ncbi:peptidase S41 [uncultured Roseobacter sp.]|uniref:peptidase S41 n=1 Tax=uncultured Roseobacter sp. TaxID=114847 RepID=UPI002613D63B|nr:peptidase S41 [uncultured Roseobacter sp.]
MPLSQDLDLILDTVERADPSFGTVARETKDRHIEAVRQSALQGKTDEFLLSAMSLLALAENGHTRLIPNEAIRVLPCRFVSCGGSVFLTRVAGKGSGLPPARLIAVNDVTVDVIEERMQPLLAGTRQRKRVTGPILMAWPAALSALGISTDAPTIRYRLQYAAGRVSDLQMPVTQTVPATELYPRNEHGLSEPDPGVRSFASVMEWPDNCRAVALPSFFDEERHALRRAVSDAADNIRAVPGCRLVLDVRGNTGGSFLEAMPLADAVTSSCQSGHCTVLMDRFTFSAAIVFVAILKYRLGNRLTLVGEEPGDGLRFFAEGGLIELPVTGALVRYSTALHDWESGSVDETTPPDIARHIVPVGNINTDRHWVQTPFDKSETTDIYRRFLDEMT